jgi:hypothetical protein
VPKVTNFFIKICPEKTREYEDHARNTSKNIRINTHIVGGARGLMDLKGSTGVYRHFFKRLEPRVTTTFLTGAFGAFGDFTIGSTSCTEGSSAAIVSAEGAVAASLFGSSLSLQSKQKARDFT